MKHPDVIRSTAKQSPGKPRHRETTECDTFKVEENDARDEIHNENLEPILLPQGERNHSIWVDSPLGDDRPRV